VHAVQFDLSTPFTIAKPLQNKPNYLLKGRLSAAGWRLCSSVARPYLGRINPFDLPTAPGSAAAEHCPQLAALHQVGGGTEKTSDSAGAGGVNNEEVQDQSSPGAG
jgi:hypothetical protein